MKKKAIRIALAALLVAVLCAAGALGARTAGVFINAANRHLNQILSAVEQDTRAVESAKTELLSAIAGEKQYFDFNYDWAEQSAPLIAHAGGGIDGVAYTNSREAFLYNYEQGHRVFEIDLELTEEYQLVAAHDADRWRALAGVSSETPFTGPIFEQTLLNGQYTPMTIGDVIDLMAEYPDAYVITDTKYTDKTSVLLQFSQLVKSAQARHPEALGRIIPQIYNEDMYDYVMRVYPFRSMIYTLYQTDWTPESVRDFCEQTGIRFVTMPCDEADAEVIRLWKEQDIHTAVHTVNDEATMQKMLALGTDMIYTDFLMP